MTCKNENKFHRHQKKKKNLINKLYLYFSLSNYIFIFPINLCDEN